MVQTIWLQLGMAIPNCNHSGFFIGSILIICIWALMTFTALVLAEVNLQMADGSNFVKMAGDTFGASGVIIVWICQVLLLYSLLAAYTVGGSLLIYTVLNTLGLNLAENITGIIFILILGIFVYISTRIVDHVNKLMLTGKLIAFFLLITFLIPHISINHLTYQLRDTSFIWVAFPILLTSFDFHHIIPTLRTYLKSDKKALRQAIILGSSIPLIIYLFWIFATLGSLPIDTSNGILSKQSGEITSVIINHFNASSKYISTISFLFGFFALSTSFLGVALGLFDFNRNTYKIEKNSHKNKILAFIITFLPAYIYATIYPDGFKAALGYASIFVAILQVALPLSMLWTINYRKNIALISTSIITIITITIAIAIIALQVLSSLNLLSV